MSHAVILDDLEVRHEAARKIFSSQYSSIKHCYNVADFVHHILTYPGTFDFVSLDHDLGDISNDNTGRVLYGTGMDAARFLSAICLTGYRPVKVNVHSHNYVCGDAMRDLLIRSGYPDTTFRHFTDD